MAGFSNQMFFVQNFLAAQCSIQTLIITRSIKLIPIIPRTWQLKVTWAGGRKGRFGKKSGEGMRDFLLSFSVSNLI